MSPSTVDLTCVNLYIRVKRLSYYPWGPSLDNPSRHLQHSRKEPLLSLPRLTYRLHIYYHQLLPLPLSYWPCLLWRQLLPPLLSTPHHSRVLGFAPAFTSHTHALHEEIRDEILKLNANSKASTNFHRRLRLVNIGDYVIVCLRPKWFSPGTVKKLHAGPFQIREKLFIWWTSHQIFAIVALLLLIIWFHVEVLLIPILIHSWISLPTTFFWVPSTASTSS